MGTPEIIIAAIIGAVALVAIIAGRTLEWDNGKIAINEQVTFVAKKRLEAPKPV